MKDYTHTGFSYLKLLLIIFISVISSTITLSQGTIEWTVLGKRTPDINEQNVVIATCELQDGSIVFAGNAYPDTAKMTFKDTSIYLPFTTYIGRVSKNGDLIFLRPVNKHHYAITSYQMDVGMTNFLTSDTSAIYLATMASGSWMPDSGQNPITLANEPLLIKFDMAGNTINSSALLGYNVGSVRGITPFYAPNDSIYISYGGNQNTWLIAFDSALNFGTSRLVHSGSNSYFFIQDRSVNGNFIGCCYAYQSSVDIDPTAQSVIIGSLNTNASAIILFDSVLNIINYYASTGTVIQERACFDNDGEIILFGTTGSSSNNGILDPLHPQGLIGGNTSFVLKYDSSLHLQWIKWIDQSVNAYIVIPNRPGIGCGISESGEITVQVVGRSAPFFNNFNLPFLNTPAQPGEPTFAPTFIVLSNDGFIKSVFRLKTQTNAHCWQVNDQGKLTIGGWLLPNHYDFSLNDVPYPISFYDTYGFLIQYDNAAEIGTTTGKLIADLNSNLINEASDSKVPFHPVYFASTGIISLSDLNGNFNIFSPAGNYTLKTSNTMNYNSSIPVSYAIQLDSIHLLCDSNDFYFTPENYVYDLSVTGTSAHAKPGALCNIWYNIQERGTLTCPAQLKITYPHNNLNFISSPVSGITTINDTLYIPIPSLTPFSYFPISLTFRTDSLLLNGDTLHLQAEVLPVGSGITDSYLSNNIDSNYIAINNIIDPNYTLSDKKETMSISEIDSATRFKYTIHFQNTGSDTVSNLVIVDTLSTLSLIWEGSSHPCKVMYNDSRILIARFNNINLPDSSYGESASRGYIQFSLQPFLPLIVGDSISNASYVYADDNLPKRTNTTSTFFTTVSQSGNLENDFNTTIYPNPSTGKLTIKLPEGSSYVTMKILDSYGRTISNIDALYKGRIEAEIRRPGIYFIILITSDGRYQMQKCIIQE
jgi:Secretion system C-terminal sorting domain